MATPEQPLVTRDELDLSLVSPAGRTLKLPVAIEDEDGRVVRRETRAFRIRGRLDTDRMIEFLQLETTINEALAATDEASHRELVAALDAGNQSIRNLLCELNDDVPLKLRLDEQQILATLAWISGDISVAEAIARVLTGGESGAQTEEELAAAKARGDAGGGAADAATPFS